MQKNGTKLHNILILGGSSDIGSELINFLPKKSNLFLHSNKKKISKSSSISKFNSFKNIICDFDMDTINLEKELKKIFNQNYDIIVNLVGYIDNKKFTNTSIFETINSIKINFLIPMLIIKNNLNYMTKKNFGKIIQCSSNGVKYGGGINTYNYALSKHLLNFIPNEIRKLANKNIIYNIISPGVVNTKLHININNKDMKKRIELIPMKRAAEIKEIVNLILYLISSDSNYINNTNISISGGE